MEGRNGPDATPGGGGSPEPARRDPGPAGEQAPVSLDAIYTAAYESNARLRFWLNGIYTQHGMPQDYHLFDTPHRSALQTPTLSQTYMLLSVRYLVIELWNFQVRYSTYTKAVLGGLDVKGTAGLRMIIKGHKVASSLKELRNDVAHTGLGFDAFAEKINSVGLNNIVHYARAALMFEDAVYRTVPHRSHRQEADAARERIPVSLTLPGREEGLALDKKYAGADFVPSAGDRGPERAKMYDLVVALLALYVSFREAAEQTAEQTLDSHLRFTSHVYNVKYMILDMHNFIVEFKKLDRGGAFTPGFMSREGLYACLRHDYAAHVRIHKIASIVDLLESRPGLLQDMVADILEVNALASRLLAGFRDSRTRITPMTREQISEIDRNMGDVQRASHGRYGGKYADPDEEQKRREARELGKKRLGLG